jgi:hypothetical protein
MTGMATSLGWSRAAPPLYLSLSSLSRSLALFLSLALVIYLSYIHAKIYAAPSKIISEAYFLCLRIEASAFSHFNAISGLFISSIVFQALFSLPLSYHFFT